MLKYVRQSGVALWADDGRTNERTYTLGEAKTGYGSSSSSWKWAHPRRRRPLGWMAALRCELMLDGTLHWNWSLGQSSSSQLHEIRWWWWRPFVQYGSLALQQQQQQLPCRPRQFPQSSGRATRHALEIIHRDTRQCTSSSSRRWTNRLGGSANDQQRSSSSTFMTWRRRCLQQEEMEKVGSVISKRGWNAIILLFNSQSNTVSAKNKPSPPP